VTSVEQLELVRRSYAAFSALDAEALVQLYTTDCRWELGEWGAVLGTETVRGHEGFRAWLSDIIELCDEMTVGILEVRVLDDHLLVHGNGHTKFKSGIEAPFPPYWQEITFAEDRIARVKQLQSEPSAWQRAAPLPL
jgi:ketosteroid isomerase-like protein